jgi:O-antigen ligase
VIHRLRIALIPAFLALCLVLGGASGGGHWANMALQLAAIPIILWSLAARRNTPMSSSARQLMILLALALVLVIIQLIPLPPSVWASLPGRDRVADGFAMLGQPLPWLPLSLAPLNTVASALWTLPAIAVFLGMIRLGSFKTPWLIWVLIAATAIGIFIGALQLSGGVNSPLYFYAITNRGAATGFFANTNNMAEMMVVAIPFLGAIYLSAVQRGGSVQKRSGLLTIVLGTVVVLAVGIAVNRSLAGIGLAVPTIAATALMIAFKRRRLPIWSAGVVAILLAGSVALVLSSPFENNLTTEQARGSSESRYTSFTTTFEAAGDYFPVGSGIGTFAEVYRQYEDPTKTDRFYMNHAHNDYLELLLETGVFGLALLALFLLWWVWRVAKIWGAEEPDAFARAATIATAVTLAHSFVEFPLRTAAVSAVFAMGCALMAEARPRVRKRRTDTAQSGGARHLSAD